MQAHARVWKLEDNLNRKMQAHARVCEENKLEENYTFWNKFAVKCVSLKDHVGGVRGVSKRYSQGRFIIA